MKRLNLVVCVLLVATLALSACGRRLHLRSSRNGAGQETVQVKETVEVKETVRSKRRCRSRRRRVVVTATPSRRLLEEGRRADRPRMQPTQRRGPAHGTNFSAFRILELTYDSLLAFDKDLAVIPNLAESWSWSDDGLALTLKLRQDVKFHSGNPLTSADVKFSFERILTKQPELPRAPTLPTSPASIRPRLYVVLHLAEPQVSFWRL